MTTYSIQAPDGKTYRIDGPPGATDDQVKAEVIKQNPHLAGGKVPAYSPNPALADKSRELTAAREATGPSPEYSPLSPNPAENAIAGLGKTIADKSLGIQQTVANLGGPGDPVALAQEAKDRALRDKPLMKDPFGRYGNLVGDVGLDVLPFMGGMKAISAASKFLPNIGAATRFGGEVAGTAALGGAESLTKPDAKERSNLKRFGEGAAFTALPDVLLRGVGQFLRPFRNTSSAMPFDIPVRERAGHSLLAEDRSDAGPTRFLTEALARGPGLGINENRSINQKLLTQELSAGTGKPVSIADPQSVRGIHDALDTEANAFRAGPDVPIQGLPERLKGAAEEVYNYGLGTNQPGTAKRLENVSDILTPRVRSAPLDEPGIGGTINEALVDSNTIPIAKTLQQVSGEQPGKIAGSFDHPPFMGIQPAVTEPTVPASHLMDLRRNASNAAFALRDTDPRLSRSVYELRNILDDAIKGTHPDQGAAYEKWLKKWGNFEDFKKGLEAPNSLEINPKIYASALDEKRQLMPAPGSADELAMASSRSMPRKGDSKLMGALGWGMMAAPPLLGGGAGYFSDNSALGTTAGLSIPALLAAALATKSGGKFLTNPETSAKMRALADAINSGVFQKD